MDTHRLRVIRVVFCASMLCAAVPAFWLGLRGSIWLGVAALLLVACVLGYWLGGVLQRAGRSAAWLVSLAVVNWLVVCPELALRAVNFYYETGVEFGYPRPSEMLEFVPDERLFWRLPANTAKTNSLGFPGREVDLPKLNGVVRLLFLGDSCTWQGYPWEVERILRGMQTDDSRIIESVVLAAPGYSSYQGRVLAEMYCADLEPDVVFVYFGWNDHWRAWGAPDAEKAAESASSTVARRGIVPRVYHHVRLLQGLAWIADNMGGRVEALEELRVPLNQYRGNLIRIGQVCGERGAAIVLITAPSGHASVGVPERLTELGLATDAESVPRLHGEYNDVVRSVSSERGWYLLDLARRYEHREDLNEIFMRDGIHFRETWVPRVAQDIVDFILLRGLISP